jgi:thiamine pyrophosphokinase
MPKKTANLFLNGNKVDYSKILNKENYNLCADGGFRNCLFNGLKPDLVIGDMDSGGDQSGFEFIKDPDQDTTDFEKAINFLIKQGFEKVLVYSYCGDRLDQMLAGLSSTKRFVEENSLEIILFTETQKVQFLPKNYKGKAEIGELLSFVPIFETKKLFTTGLKWNLSGQDLIFGKFISTSNEAVSEDFSLDFESGGLVMLRNW